LSQVGGTGPLICPLEERDEETTPARGCKNWGKDVLKDIGLNNDTRKNQNGKGGEFPLQIVGGGALNFLPTGETETL